ncbi:benzoate/H(+) symporter BenE family transporter [Longispora albida]|uniref:benzoate/H(+) symporter BenE family transporter n=1 Tax=Longispora albida TaxID=203523 RepID=UPI000364AB68|nr:benzoate/H(+) symporter BenE family transporter [Longispora albida]
MPATLTSRSDVSLSAVTAGAVAVLIGCSGPLVIVITAATNAGLSPAQTTSWVWAMLIGCGFSSVILSIWTRTPVITAWSTPGAALLVTSLLAFRYSDAIGAFLLAGIAATLIGVTGLFGKIMARVPRGVTAAMLAGILLPFVLATFTAIPKSPVVVLAVIAAYLLGRRFLARYAILLALGAGVAAAGALGQFRPAGIRLDLAVPVWTTPTFGWPALVSIGIPLLLVTMASQNAPGLAVLRASGYEPRDRLLLTGTGIASVLFAPFGSHAINLAAITAAICTGEDAHPNPAKRYVAGIASGITNLLFGLFGTALVQVFAALPRPLVAAVTGVALLGAVLTGLAGALEDVPAREPALITLAVTASGVTMLGVGSAFWGLVAGMGTYLVLRRKTG